MTLRTIVVSEADSVSHEELMRARGLHLARKDAIDQHSWRYVWATSPIAAVNARSSDRPPAPASPPALKPPSRAAPPRPKPVRSAPQQQPNAPSPAAPAAATRDLDAHADELIAAFQTTLVEARTLPLDLRALVVHAVAESARHAGVNARLYGSEAVAERFDKYDAALPDVLGRVFGIARDQALKWAKGQGAAAMAAPGGALAWATTKLYAAGGFLAGAVFAGLQAAADLGAQLLQHGSGLRLLMLAGYALNVYLTNEAAKDLREARNSTLPAQDLLRRTLAASEHRFFSALGTSPPTRRTLNASGWAQAGVLAIGIGLLCIAFGAIVFGGLARVVAGPTP